MVELNLRCFLADPNDLWSSYSLNLDNQMKVLNKMTIEGLSLNDHHLLDQHLRGLKLRLRLLHKSKELKRSLLLLYRLGMVYLLHLATCVTLIHWWRKLQSILQNPVDPLHLNAQPLQKGQLMDQRRLLLQSHHKKHINPNLKQRWFMLQPRKENRYLRLWQVEYLTIFDLILSPEGTSVVGRTDFLRCLRYRFLGPRQKSLTVTLWNALKPHFKLSESLIIFKRKMKADLLNQFLIS